MASQLGYVINASSETFLLTNTIAGNEQPSDAANLPPNSITKTGGADNNWITIPDATPPDEYFTQDNIKLSNGTDNLYVYATQGTAYWLVNSSPTKNYYGEQFANSGNYMEVFLVISREDWKWRLSLFDIATVR